MLLFIGVIWRLLLFCFISQLLMAAVMNSSFQSRIDEMEKRVKADTEAAKTKARTPNTLIVEASEYYFQCFV